MSAFTYDSLNGEDHEIRLVRFSDTDSTASTELEFVMKRASLNDPPLYHALSYVWGDPSPTGSIRVNGSDLPVARSLHEALSELHQGKDAREWIWIDAICINQADDEERSWHVPRMGNIFSRAALVYIWLGPSSHDSDLVMQMVQRIGPEAHEAGVADLWASFQSFSYGATRPQKDPAKEKNTHLVLARALDDEELRSHRLLKAMERLLLRANWCRAWIVQEVALAQDALVLCGAERVVLDAFDAALSVIFFCKNGRFARQLPQWRRFGANMGLNNNTFRPRGLVARRQRGWGHQAGLLEFLLSDYLGSPDRPFYTASDPRDIIFGFLGIAADTEHLGLQTDYGQTAAEIYTAATRAMLERCPDYSLDYCTFPKDTPDLPSWVPDWHRIGRLGVSNGSGAPLSIGNFYGSGRGRVQPPPPAASPPHIMDDIAPWRILCQRGCLVDVVSAVFKFTVATPPPSAKFSWTLSVMLKPWSPGEERARVLESALAFAQETHHEVNNGQVETVLWRTLTAGRMPSRRRSPPEFDVLADRVFRQQPLLAAELNEAQSVYVAQSVYPYPAKPESAASQAIVDKYSEVLLAWASAMCRGRTLFATAKGKLGIGPENMQAQDIVTILWGMRVPIVLRPVANHFSYLGGAYMHGIMDGELMKGDPPERDFHIA